LSLEGRRRVKEQLKKMGSFEFHQTSFSLIDNETREERFIGVPEQGGRDMISLDSLAPGSVSILRSDFLTQGPVVPQFQHAVAARCSASYAVAANSGTSTLHMTCKA
jgi:predicted ATP-dependent Lon-type protease